MFDDYATITSEYRYTAIEATKGKEIEALSPKQMLQRLPIALALVKAGNTYKNLINEIHWIIYSFYRAKRITKNVYN